MIVNMRGIWGVLSVVGSVAVAFGGTARAVDHIRLHDAFFTLVVDSSLDSRTNDYVDLIRTTKQTLKTQGKDPKVLRQLSEMWISSAKNGKIAQVFPGYYGESLIDGPKADIFRTCTELSNRLSESADSKLDANDPDRYLDAVRAIELINIVRYGSYETLFASTGYLRRPTKILKSNLTMLSPEVIDRLQKAQNIDERNSKTQFLEELTKRQRNQYTARYGTEMTVQDDSSYVSLIARQGGRTAAEHFFGFDREIKSPLTKKRK